MKLTTSLIGRIGKDAEAKQIGEMYAINFSVATTETWMDKKGEKQEKTTWCECVKWNKSDKLATYLTKGTQVSIEGVPSAYAYLDKNNEAKAVLEIKVKELLFVGSKDQVQKEPSQQSQTAPVNDDDLPF
jgi:single-strand DNA-binding protein